MTTEIIFEVREDEADGGYTASAFGHDVFTAAETLAEVRGIVREAKKSAYGSQLYICDGEANDWW